MPPLSFLLEQSWRLSCLCCPEAPGATAGMSTSCSSHLHAIGTQLLLVPVTHPCQSTCLQHTKNVPVKPQPGLKRPWGASSWSPSRCKPSSPLGKPGSPQLPSCPEPLGKPRVQGPAEALTALCTEPVGRTTSQRGQWTRGQEGQTQGEAVSCPQGFSLAQCAWNCCSPLLLL